MDPRLIEKRLRFLYIIKEIEYLEFLLTQYNLSTSPYVMMSPKCGINPHAPPFEPTYQQQKQQHECSSGSSSSSGFATIPQNEYSPYNSTSSSSPTSSTSVPKTPESVSKSDKKCFCITYTLPKNGKPVIPFAVAFDEDGNIIDAKQCSYGDYCKNKERGCKFAHHLPFSLCESAYGKNKCTSKIPCIRLHPPGQEPDVGGNVISNSEPQQIKPMKNGEFVKPSILFGQSKQKSAGSASGGSMTSLLVNTTSSCKYRK